MTDTHRRNPLSEGFRFGLGFFAGGALLAGAAGAIWTLVVPRPEPQMDRATVIVEDGPAGPTETVWVPPQKPAQCLEFIQLRSETGPALDAYRKCRNGSWMTFGIIPETLR